MLSRRETIKANCHLSHHGRSMQTETAATWSNAISWMSKTSSSERWAKMLIRSLTERSFLRSTFSISRVTHSTSWLECPYSARRAFPPFKRRFHRLFFSHSSTGKCDKLRRHVHKIEWCWIRSNVSIKTHQQHCVIMQTYKMSPVHTNEFELLLGSIKSLHRTFVESLIMLMNAYKPNLHWKLSFCFLREHKKVLIEINAAFIIMDHHMRASKVWITLKSVNISKALLRNSKWNV